MTNKEILDIYLENGLIRTCVECQFAHIKDKSLREDFFQDLCLLLLEHPKLEDAHNNNKMNAFISAICTRQLFSRTSPFYKAYRKFLDRANTEITDELADTTPDTDNE